MRLRHRDGTVVHLGYGTNVLPAEDVDGLVAQAVGMGERIRRALADVPGGAPDQVVGLGLWLPAAAAHRLAADPAGVRRVRSRLAEHGVEIVTLNAFPYAAFQGRRRQARRLPPDLGRARAPRLHRSPRRACWPGCCPTTPTTGRSRPCRWPGGSRGPTSDQQVAEAHLAELAAGLARLEDETGRRVVVGIEPEPGCVVETVEQAVERLAAVDRDRIGVCLDLCHLAVGFDDGDRALDAARRRRAAGRQGPAGDRPRRRRPGRRRRTRARSASYAEDRFLHQVRQVRPAARVAGPRRPARGARRTGPAGHRRAVARPLPRAGARRPAAAAAHRGDRRPARLARPPCSADRPPASTTSRSRPTPGRCCPAADRPTTTSSRPGSPPSSAGSAPSSSPSASPRSDAAPHRRTPPTLHPPGGTMDKLLVADVVGLTPDLLQHMPRLRRLADERVVVGPRAGPARRHLQRAVDVPDRPHARPSTASSATAGTSATSARCSCGASTTASCRARRSGTRSAARSPGYTVANVCWWYAMGATTDWTVTPRPDLLRRRQEGPRLLHPPAGAARRARRRARRVPAVPVLGTDRLDPLDRVDRGAPPGA